MKAEISEMKANGQATSMKIDKLFDFLQDLVARLPPKP
jgi:hypothetical protein